MAEKLRKARRVEIPRFLEENKELLKEYALSQEDIQILAKRFGSITNTLLELIYLFPELEDSDVKTLTTLPLDKKKLLARTPIKNAKLKALLRNISLKKPYYDFYIRSNFSFSIINDVFGKVENMEEFMKALARAREDKYVESMINHMLGSERFHSLGLLLKNSDIFVRTIFVRAVLPNLLAGGFSGYALRHIMDLLKAVTGKTTTYYDFFRLLQKFNEMLFLFGSVDGKVVLDVLRCQ